jgi:hypothetical protein
VVAPTISTIAALVDVGNMEFKEPAGALAPQGLAGKLPGVAEKVCFGWLKGEAVEKAGPLLVDAGTALPSATEDPGNDIQEMLCRGQTQFMRWLQEKQQPT